MDYEKRYKEAMNIARKMIDDLRKGEDILAVSELETMFPELCESEDERIRKELIEHIKANCETGFLLFQKFSPDKIIAWLEKQEELKSSNWTEGDVVRHGGILALVTNGRKAMKSNFEQITIQYPDEWVKAETKERKYFFEELEKQGQVKESSILQHEGTHKDMSCKENDNSLTRESKFKVGDWIVFNGFTLLVNEVVQGYYRTIDIGGIPNSYDWNIDNIARLWSIEDAKDGDMLTSKHNQPFIYNGIFDEESVGAYCGIDKFGNDFLKGIYSCDWSYKEGVKPATKEQCDLLFQKMKEAGYEWDADKKELKKINDERIKKGLIKAVSGTLKGNTLYGTDVTREEALAWSEKQGIIDRLDSIFNLLDERLPIRLVPFTDTYPRPIEPRPIEPWYKSPLNDVQANTRKGEEE